MTPPTLAELPPPPPGRHGWPWTASGGTVAPLDMPAITLVTPSFRQAEFLEETLRSVLLQGYPRLQYVVMDGGSDDGSREILARYAPWLHHHQSAADDGQAAAINAGWRHGDGPLVGWLNSDDLLLPGALARAAATAMRTGADLVFGDVVVVDRASQPTGAVYRAEPLDPRSMLARWHCPVPQQGFLIRRELLTRLGPLDESLYFALDLEYWLRAALAGAREARVDGEPLAAFRVYRDSKTGGQHERFVADMRRIGERLRQTAPGDALRAAAALGLARGWANAAANAFAWRMWDLTRRYAWRDLRARGMGAIEPSLWLAWASIMPGNRHAWYARTLGARRLLAGPRTGNGGGS